MSTVLAQKFKLLLSKEWLSNEKLIDDIVVTTNDYTVDFYHFKPKYLKLVTFKWHNKIKFEYIKGFLQK